MKHCLWFLANVPTYVLTYSRPCPRGILSPHPQGVDVEILLLLAVVLVASSTCLVRLPTQILSQFMPRQRRGLSTEILR